MSQKPFDLEKMRQYYYEARMKGWNRGQPLTREQVLMQTAQFADDYSPPEPPPSASLTEIQEPTESPLMDSPPDPFEGFASIVLQEPWPLFPPSPEEESSS